MRKTMLAVLVTIAFSLVLTLAAALVWFAGRALPGLRSG